jgi:DNA-binding NarL/FixJ family response regulator
MKIKIMIADDQRLMREGLKTILDLEQDMTVVCLAENGKDALDKMADAQPDIVLMDIRMPVMDGVECTRIIKQQHQGVKVLILTTFDDDEYIIDALKNGAAGYVLKDLSSEKLTAAIRDVYNGNSLIQPEIAAKLISRITGSAVYKSPANMPAAVPGSGDPKASSIFSSASKQKLAQELTEREADVLRLVGKGMTNAEIAKALYITEGTVKNYISSLYSKLDVNDRSKLTLFALDMQCDI